MQHPDEGTIHAWLDGELSAEEAAALESHVATCTECSARVAEARGFVAGASRIVSALDIVPGGVIPSAALPARRPWYLTTQFRAAAALLIVAGASALLLNRGERQQAQDTMRVSAGTAEVASAPLDATPETTTTAPADNNGVVGNSGTARRAVVPIVQTTPQTKPKALDKTAAAATPPSVPRPANEAVAQNQALNPMARRAVRDTSAQFADATAASVADLAAPQLTLMKADTSKATVRNVYEVTKGVEVTLVETTLPQRNFSAGAVTGRSAMAPMPVAAPAPPAAKVIEAPVNTITWNRGNTVFTLTGRMSVSELEGIRKRLPEDKR